MKPYPTRALEGPQPLDETRQGEFNRLYEPTLVHSGRMTRGGSREGTKRGSKHFSFACRPYQDMVSPSQVSNIEVVNILEQGTHAVRTLFRLLETPAVLPTGYTTVQPITVQPNRFIGFLPVSSDE